ncbi:chaplin [Streptomyces sp. NPDC048362]|uniref:chaplin n=1 Tax=Streptomyces sp. NPDC048362 TaxID=3365539 RepID=UPI00371CBA41
MIAVAAASGAMAVALPVSPAFAADGATADGTAAGSPGLISGNGIQLPVHVPVNVCGNSVNVVGLLNPAAGNTCANTGTAHAGGIGGHGSDASGGASARGGATGSPGVLSGNGIQLPVHLPVNISGNSVNVVGLGNPAEGNHSVNGPTTPPRTPRAPAVKPPAPAKSRPAPRSPAARPAVASLAHTGTDLTTPAVAGSAALLLTGTVLYRRFAPGRTR